MNTSPIPSFNDNISLIKVHEPEIWKRYEQSFDFDKSFVSHDMQNILIKEDAIKYLKEKIRTLQDEMSSLPVKFGIRVYFNGESEKLIDEICAKIKLASIKDFHNKEKYDTLTDLYQRRLKP